MAQNIHRLPMEELIPLVKLQLENGARAQLTVTGYSMMPMLRNRRDRVELIPAGEQCHAGDVALYCRDNGQYVLHRIVACTPNGYICCGDNQAMREPVRHDQLLAVVDAFVRKGKRCEVTDLGYRMYTAIWVKLFFLRRPYIGIRRCLGRLWGKIRKNRRNKREE